MSFLESNLNAKEFLEKSTGDYSYHSIQIDLPLDLSNIQKEIKEEDIYIDPEDHSYGLEDEIHVTVCYGIRDEKDYEGIKEYLSNYTPFNIQLKGISSFRNDDKPYDVLKIDVISSDLEKIHYYIRENFNAYFTFPKYHPHTTIGYIKKDTCKDLEKIDKPIKNISIDKMVFIHKDKYKLPLPLKMINT